MWFHHHREPLPSPFLIHKKMKEAEDQQDRAKEELNLAKKIAKEMSEMRETNHFARDWRKAIGGKDGH